MDSGFVFFGFAGTSQGIPPSSISGEIQLWNLIHTSYEEFKDSLIGATGIEGLHDDRFSVETYDECKWGLLLPYVHASNSALVLTNLFSENYLYPFFYFDSAQPVDMKYALPRFWHKLHHGTQNPSSSSDQTKLDSFHSFYFKLQEASPYLTLHTDKLYGIQKKRIYKAIEIFDRIGRTYTSLDSDHEAFYLDFTRLLECLLIDDEYDPRGFCSRNL